MSTAGTATSAVRREVGRKAIHIATAAIPVGWAAGAPTPWVVALLTALTLVALTVEVARRTSPRAREAFTRLVGPLLRPAERDGALAGATWMFAAYLGAVLVAPQAVALTAMWGVAAGDGAAAIVGRLAGRHRLRNGKSWEGAAAMAVVTAAGAWGLAGWPWPQAVAFGGAATAAELPSGPLNDNLRVTVACVTLGMLMFSRMH